MGTVKKEKNTKETKMKQQVYCGPSLPGLPQFAVLKGESNPLRLYKEQYPQIEKLIVSIDQLNFTRIKLAQKGSYQQKVYLEIQELTRGGNK